LDTNKNMKELKEESLIYLHFIGPLVIWASLLYLSGSDLNINWEALKKIPDAITIYLIFQFLFRKWLWKWSIFRGWLITTPYIQGTWEGDLTSTWVNPETGQAITSIKMTLVIKQSLNRISCVIFTKESESYSVAAQINEDDDSGIFRLSYNYTNRSRITLRDKSPVHDGAANLRIITAPERRLEGSYWTSRKTTGDINLRFKSKELAQTYLDN
jgi:hypothetical protein